MLVESLKPKEWSVSWQDAFEIKGSHLVVCILLAINCNFKVNLNKQTSILVQLKIMWLAENADCDAPKKWGKKTKHHEHNNINPL